MKRRRKSNKTEVKSISTSFKMTPTQRNKLEDRAWENRMTVSAYIMSKLVL